MEEKMRWVEDEVYLIVEKATGWVYSSEREQYDLHNRKFQWVKAICKREQVWQPSKLAFVDYAWYDTGREIHELVDDNRVYVVTENGHYLVSEELAKSI